MTRISPPADDPTTPDGGDPLLPLSGQRMRGEGRTLVPPPPRTMAATVAALVVAVAVVALLLTVFPPGASQAPHPASAPPPAEGSPAPEEEEEAEEAPAPEDEGIHAVLEVSVRSWVEATVDGDSAFEEVLEEGRRVELRAREDLELMLGNAGGIRLEINGEEMPTGEPGEVVRLFFAWEDGRLVRG